MNHSGRADYEKITLAAHESFVCREVCGPRFEAPWHFHPEIELTTILSSSGQRFVGDSIESFIPGDLVLLGSETPHYWHTLSTGGPDHARAIVIQFRADFPGETFFNLPEMNRVGRLLRRAKAGLVFESEERIRIVEHMTDLVSTDSARRLPALLDLLLTLAEDIDGRLLSSPDFESISDPKAGERINRCCQFIIDRLDQDIPLAEAAGVAGMSPSAFCRYFKRVTGRTFSRFVNELRIGQAGWDLLETERSVSEIAYAVG
ncbi:MAG: AraC family transcriptional regulator, partial [Verrucomicrobiota bacterium]